MVNPNGGVIARISIMSGTTVLRNTVAAAGLALFFAGGASAATVGFSGASLGTGPIVDQGFSFDVAKIVNGSCDNASKPCLALDNFVPSTTVTRVDGGSFSLTSIWFKLAGTGSGNQLILGATGGTLVLGDTVYTKNHAYNIGQSVLSLFQNVTSITFATVAGGNVRIDDLELTPSPVPVPAAAGLLTLALGGLGFAGRRRKA